MIQSRADVMDLLNAYLVTQHEWTHQFWMLGSEGWSGEKEAIYSNGVVFGKFRENDEATMQIMKIGVKDEALKEEIRLEIKRYIKELEQLEELDFMTQMKLDSQKRQLRELHMISMDEWITKNCGWLEEDSQGLTDSEIRVLIYLYYSFENFNYERRHPYCRDLDGLEEEYKSVWDKQSQFYKYGIVPVDGNREII